MKATSLLLSSLVVLSFVAGCGSREEEDAQTSDDELRATKTLLCASASNATVYYGQESQILLEANVSRDGVLANAALRMTTDSNLGIRNETWKAQTKYTPSNPKYQGMQKYSSADAWCGYSVIAPKNLNGQAGKFSVYVQQACEGGFISTALLSCKVESKNPIAPDGPIAAAAVELRFSAAGKKDAVDSGYYEASEFSGNNIVIASASTRIDLDQLIPDGSESAPDTVCYSGDASTAKKILWAMLSNTDGNGDHWLDDGAEISSATAKALRVEYSVTGEGGSEPKSLLVPVCK